MRLPTGAAPVPIPAGTPLPGGVAIDLAGLDRGQIFRQFAKTKQYRRCPGGADLAARDGTNVFSVEEQQQLVPPPPGVSYPGPDCRERDRAVGPVSTRPSAP